MARRCADRYNMRRFFNSFDEKRFWRLVPLSQTMPANEHSQNKYSSPKRKIFFVCKIGTVHRGITSTARHSIRDIHPRRQGGVTGGKLRRGAIELIKSVPHRTGKDCPDVLQMGPLGCGSVSASELGVRLSKDLASDPAEVLDIHPAGRT
jgi:hypothetical protein